MAGLPLRVIELGKLDAYQYLKLQVYFDQIDPETFIRIVIYVGFEQDWECPISNYVNFQRVPMLPETDFRCCIQLQGIPVRISEHLLQIANSQKVTKVSIVSSFD